MSEVLKSFLIARSTTSTNFSHVVHIDNVAIKVNIDNTDLENFYNLCTQHIINPSFQFSIIEKPTDKCNLFIDIDFKSEIEMPTYTTNDIETIINAYNNELAELHFHDTRMEAFVLELNQVLNLPIVSSSGTTIYKNGIHIIYPNIKMTHDEMNQLHAKVKTNLSNDGFVRLDNAIDTCVHTGLYLYGFGKQGKPQYALTKIYSHDLSIIDANVHEASNNLRKYLSIRS